MMAHEEGLPRFHKPPIDEVIIGLQFPPIEQIAVIQGLFYGSAKDQFPKVLTQPPFSPISDEPGVQPFPVFGLSSRALYISLDDASVIQLQADRLVFNWRKRVGAYPHFDEIQGGFWLAYDRLCAALSNFGLSEVAVNQCEVGYINALTSEATGVSASEVDKVLKPWKNDFAPDWPVSLEDLSFTARYKISDLAGQTAGRLNVMLGTHMRIPGGPTLRLDLLARGRPFFEGRAGIKAFQDEAHKLIVRCFTSMTQPEMHQRWDRYQ